MSTVITSGTISSDWLQFDPDNIYDGAALPNAGDTTSAEYASAGYDQGGVAIYVDADTTVDIDSTETLDMFLITYDAAGGSEVETIPFFSVTGPKTYEIGEKIAEVIPSEVGPWFRLKITASADESADKINAYPRRVSS
jgi:hypothetical protein